MKRALNNQPDVTPCGSTDNRKRNKTANPLHPFKNGAGKLLLILSLLMTSVSAWAADYVIFNNGYYLAYDGTLKGVQNFDPATCIWKSSATNNGSGTFYITYENTTRYLRYNNGLTTSNQNNATTFYLRNTNQLCRTRGGRGTTFNPYTYSDFLRYNNGWQADGNAQGNCYAVTINPAVRSNEGINAPTISCDGLNGNAGLQMARTGISGSYVPAHSTYDAHGEVIGHIYNNTFYANTDAFKVTVNENDATSYTWSVTAGNATINNTTGVLTLTANTNSVITVRCRAVVDGVNKDATYTLNVTATAALNETVYGEMTITPAITMLDLGGTSTYTASASITKVTRTRPQYVTITDQQSHTHYKVGTTYQASAPTITETPGSANFTQIGWSFSGGAGNYYNPSTYSSQSTNELVLTRTATVTGTQQTFTITATGRYDGWEGPEKTANATVTIPLTQVDITNLYPGEALALGMGGVGSVVGHYSWQPNDPSAGQTYTNFKYTSNSTSIATVDASGNVTAVGPGSTTITITAVKLDGTDGVSCNVTVNVAIDPPTINIDGSGNVTITHPADGVTIRYTTNGTDPTATTGTVYNGAFGPVANETTVKAVAVANSSASAVSSGLYATSGISGTKVILNDYEDHNWTYYQPNGGVDASYAYPDQLCSPYPRNVKITYLGNGLMYTGADGGTTVAATGVQVSRYETENTFVYYKTLERDANDRFPYELIPNPFSKRPVRTQDGTTKWRGFYGWRIKSVTGGTIYDNGGTQRSVGYIFTTEYDKISFQPTDNTKTNANNATSMEVEFEAVWARAYRVAGNTGALAGNLASTTLQTGVSYERNFVVVTDGTTGAINTINGQRPATIMMIEPDGSTDYRTTGRYISPGNIIANNVLKIEWCNLRAGHISANNYDMILGRGIMYNGASHTANNGTYGTPGDNLNGNYISTIGRVESNNNVTAYTNTNTRMRVESGVYTDLNYLCRQSQGLRGTASGSVYTYGIVGNDYDRAKNDGQALSNNTRLRIRNHISQGVGGTGATFTTGNHNNANRKTFDLVIKSGYVGSNWDATINNGTYRANYEEVVYIGVSTSTRTCGFRYMTMEGGNIAAIAGGCDQWAGDGDNPSTDHQNNPDFYNRPSVNIRIRGNAIVRGPLYAGAANARTYGARKVIMTGGTIKGWLAAGCNGTSDNGGINFGPSYLYVGGTGQVNSGGSNNMIEASQGGNVFGAGSGRAGNNQTGRMRWGTNVVVADDAIVERNVYGGGNMGYASEYTKMFLTGGTVHGTVFGGSNQKPGDKMDMLVTGGVFEGGIYGGSNVTGAINNYVKMDIFGGQIGLPSAPANIHGGGYGRPTNVVGNVDLTIGKSGATTGPLIFGDVYGGSALGQVNANATITYNTTNPEQSTITGISYNNGTHTYVTMNKGTIHGSLYGGALGNAGTAANVYGPVQVKVYGGSVFNTDGTGANGSGAVYGCNNINGEPQRTVTVDIYGTDPAPAEDQYALFAVYGGGNQANYSKGTPVVTVHNCDNSIEYVYGGGNAAHITNGNTDVTIWGGNKIGNVFGGGNGQVRAANISGSTNVKIYGGTIENVFPGSNTNGTIGGNLNLTIEKHAGTDGCEGDGMCPFDLGNVYSGGNKAASIIGNVTIGCLGNGDKITNLFGGAKQANVTGNVNLLITGNHIENVFGGNDISGQPSGTITVVVDWDPTCTGAYLGNVYGGGRDASYEAPNGNKDYPQVFVRNAVVEHDVFGGGLGESALVTGNPQVTVSTQCPTQGHANDHMVHIKGSLYGGGSAAPVTGNPVVNTRGLAGDAKKVQIDNHVFGGGFGQTAVVTGNTEVNIKGNTVVNKNVYGGGNGGLVTGNTNIVIGD